MANPTPHHQRRRATPEHGSSITRTTVSDWLPWISLVLSVWVAVLSVYIVFERRSPLSTISWILALSVLPVIGFAVYFFLGPRRFDRKKLRRTESQAVVQSVVAHSQMKDGVDDGHPSSYLMRMSEAAAGTAARPQRANFELYFSGLDKYAALVRDIEAAKHHINMEYYIWEPDQIGTRLRDALAAKAAEGVEVRVHVDGVGSAQANKRFWRPLTEAGGRVVHFNTLTIRRVISRRMGNFRTHRKIAVIDGRIGYSGGMNVTDVHTEEFSGDEAWRDTHIRLVGPAVRGLQLVFCEGWHYSAGESLEGDDYFPDTATFDEGGHTVQIVSSGPDENRNAIHKLFVTSMFAAEHRVYLTSPYFVPDATTFDALTTAALRGADVRVLVPRRNDLKLVGAASRSYYPELLDMGVRLFEYGPRMLHAKTLVVDNLVAVVGTANADARSFRLNFEVVVASYDGVLCSELADAFERDLESAVEVTPETIASYSLGRRLGQNFARLMSPVL